MRVLKMGLQLQSNGLLEHLRLLNRGQIALHQRADGLPHGFLAHLERVADLDLFDPSQRILPRNALPRLQPLHLVVVLRLLKFVEHGIDLTLIRVACNVYGGVLYGHEALLH